MQSIYLPTLILPDSILRDPKIAAAAEALNLELRKLSAATYEVLHLPRLDELEGRILDYLAEQFHVDFYEPLYLSDVEKRNLIRDSIAWHRRKGTVAAVEEVAAKCFRDVAIDEWFDYGGAPYHFRVTSKGFKYSDDGIKTFLRLINSAKNVRSHLDKIIIDYSTDVPINLYAGLVDIRVGMRTIEPPKPADFVQQIYAGLVNARVGNRTVELGRPKGFTQRLHVGQVVIRGGERIINADLSDLPTYDELIENGLAELLIADVGLARPGRIQIPVQKFDEVLSLPIYAGVAEIRNGMREIGLARPPDQVIKLHAGLAQVKRGERFVGLETHRNVTTKNILRVGQVLFRTGSRTIGTSDDIAEITHRIRNRSEKLRVNVGQVLGRFGSRTVGYGNRMHSEYKLLKIHAGQILARTGSRIIMAEDERFEELVGDWLRLIFASDYGRREVTLPNPRDDLERAEIKSVGDFAIDNELLLTRDGDLVNRLIRAELIKLSEQILF